MDFDPLPAAAGDPLATIAALAVGMPAFGAAQVVALACALVCLLLSGFFSGSEIAYFSLDEAQRDELSQDPSAAKAVRLLGQPDRLLATILIANNLVNVTIVVLTNYALGPLFVEMPAALSFVLQTVILTFLILLFGEILPKLIANSGAIRWARLSASPLLVAMRICYPLSSLLVKSSGLVNRVVAKQTDNVTADDLTQALEITAVSTSDQKEMLEGILRFGDTTAAEIMTPRVDITDIDVADSFDSVMHTIITSGYSRLPVVEGSGDNIKGILYARDMLPYVGQRAADFKWQRLIREPYFVPEARMIDDLLEDFRRRRIHLAIVVDEYGGTQGIVTMEDVLEEIVGDINDEYDDDEKTYKRLPDNTFIFEGKTLLGDFFRVTGLDEDEYEAVTADCETLAGMLLSIKGDFPKEKEPLVYGRCRFLILDIDHHRISSVCVKVMDEVQNS